MHKEKLPRMPKDPGVLLFPCTIGTLFVSRAFTNLVSSINFLPFDVLKKLGLGEPTRMSIKLVDRMIKYPRGIIEDVLVQISNFIFPVDFVVMDVIEVNVHLILGCPFLATSKAIIDVGEGKITLKMGDEKVVLRLSDAIYAVIL